MVGDHTEITADRVFLAAGCMPFVPDIPGLKGTPYMTSTEALRTTELPKKLIVIGGGYIAVELGHYFGGLGSEVHMMARSKLLKNVDAEVRDEFEAGFSKHYNVHTGVQFKQVSHDAATGTFTLSYSNDSGEELSLEADGLLVAAGTQPMGPELDLDKGGVQMTKDGFVSVDGHLRTSAPGRHAR